MFNMWHAPSIHIASDWAVLINNIRENSSAFSLPLSLSFRRRRCERATNESNEIQHQTEELSSIYVKEIDTVGFETKPLSGHASTIHNGYFYTFGGFEGKFCFDNLLSLNLNTYCWEEIISNNIDADSRPIGRASCSFTSLDEKGSLNGILLVGGSGVSVGRDSMSDIWLYNSTENIWIKVKTNEAEGPGEIYGHSTVYLGNGVVLLFGGTNGDHFYNSVFTLTLIKDGSQGIWKKMKDSNYCPSERYRQCCVLNKEKTKLYVIGGGKTLIHQDCNVDVWELDLISIRSDFIKWKEIKSSNSNPPCQRLGHTCILTEEGKIFLFGGRGYGGRKLNDAYYFDIETQSWTLETKLSETISARDFHTSVLDSRTNAIYIFGGATKHHSKNKNERCNNLYRFQTIFNPPSLLCLCAKRIQTLLCESDESTCRAMELIRNERERAILKSYAVQNYLRDLPDSNLVIGISKIHRDSLDFPFDCLM